MTFEILFYANASDKAPVREFLLDLKKVTPTILLRLLRGLTGCATDTVIANPCQRLLAMDFLSFDTLVS